MHDNLSTVWQPSNGRFDDGVDERQAPVNLPPSKRGPHFEELMKLHELTEEDITKNTCCDCGTKHERRNRRCFDCEWKKKQKRDESCASNVPNK